MMIDEYDRMGDSKLPESVYIRGGEYHIKDAMKIYKSAHLGRNISWKDRQVRRPLCILFAATFLIVR